MKTLLKSFRFGLILFAITLLFSCEKKKTVLNDGIGTAEFSVSIPDGLIQKKSSSSSDSGIVSYHLLVSVQDLAGAMVFTDKMIPLYSFGTGFTSENVQIKAGEFRLTRLMVINSTGKVEFAAPVLGSPNAYLTKKPLPLSFRILPDQVTKIDPEVLAVGDQTPDKFGYSTFGIQIIKPLQFFTLCVFDPGNPLIMAPIQITTAKLSVFAPDGWRYSFKLEASVNQFLIRGGYDIYTFVVEKEGYLPVKLQVTLIQLLATSQDNPLVLKIPWGSISYKSMVLQPGPDAGKDAMISNLEPDKNFGAHKYFEATILSEPVLTVMRSNRSLIWFDTGQLPDSAVMKRVVLTLWYDLPIPWDINKFPAAVPGSSLWYGAVLQQIVEPWEEGKVTWNAQPKTSEINQVFISPFVKNANIVEYDVTGLFLNPAANPLSNYGMMFRLFPDEKFPGFRFASSDFPEPAMRPRLTVFYAF